MAGRILRYANAAHGGSLRHIASLPQAIVFLGLFRVRQVALGFSLIDHYRSGNCLAFDYQAYWTASLAASIAAQQVAHRAQCPPDESFTCGLLSGVGRLALATVSTNTARSWPARRRSWPSGRPRRTASVCTTPNCRRNCWRTGVCRRSSTTPCAITRSRRRRHFPPA